MIKPPVAGLKASEPLTLEGTGTPGSTVTVYDGDSGGALKVAEAVLKRDPNNPQAQMIRDAARRNGNAGDDNDLRLVNLQDPAAGGAPAGAAPWPEAEACWPRCKPKATS